ncbi:MAG: hypothetical protein CVU71_06410 [Deltaproteobacteria bacterium HGW-Deltaproteobacteria-6]|nr:MAG: hypothetical protein CVU71_06410 [Deltaproteobacteria bacterium HGW-Deltaproteobacteria-6]
MFILLSTDVLLLRRFSAFATGEEFNSPIARSQFTFIKPYNSHKKTDYEYRPISFIYIIEEVH